MTAREQQPFTCLIVVVYRAINQLYLLEITKYLQAFEEDHRVTYEMGEHSQHAGHERPIRKAAITAINRIELSKTNAMTILFNILCTFVINRQSPAKQVKVPDTPRQRCVMG